MKPFSLMLLAFLIAIAHVTDGAVVRGSTTTSTTQFLEELQATTSAAELKERQLKGGDKNKNKGGGTTTVTQPAVVQEPVVECEGCCCSMDKNGVTKCCGKTCANGMLCLT